MLTQKWPVHPAADKFPMITGSEFTALAEDIAEHGLREPVWLWRDREDGVEYLLDGRNRIAACAESGTHVATRYYDGPDPISFVVSLNVTRRHLNEGQKAFIALELVPLYEEQSEKSRRAAISVARTTEKTVADRPPSQPQPKSRDKAAAVVGTSGRSVARAKRIKEKAPDLQQKVESGELAIDRADRIIRDREAADRRVEQAKADAALIGIKTRVDIRHGDFREVLSDLENIDAIITDPPYPHEFIPLLGDLAALADKILAPDGIMAILIGQTYLPEVYRLLDTGRPYRWTGCYLTPGAGYASMKARVQSNWKPLIVYGGGPRFTDVVKTEGTDADAKNNHKWGQDYGAFHTIVERLTQRGQTVVDPFMGAGTTLLAAHALGRNAIGCDIDQAHVERTRERLA
jgi:hypothetical protein